MKILMIQNEESVMTSKTILPIFLSLVFTIATVTCEENKVEKAQTSIALSDDEDLADDNNADDDTHNDDSTDDELEEDIADDDIQEDDAIDDDTSDDFVCDEDVCSDYSSGLMWQKDSNCCLNWDDSMNYCQDLDFDGYDDWRLPSVSEGRSLIRDCEATETGGYCMLTDSCLLMYCLDETCLIGCSPGYGPGSNGYYWPNVINGDCCEYWTSSNIEGDNGKIYIDFEAAYLYEEPVFFHNNIRCVRYI